MHRGQTTTCWRLSLPGLPSARSRVRLEKRIKLPHNGKMFGFYDPTDPALDSHTPPFNKKFLSYITKQRIDTRQAPVDAFKKCRKTCDPKGLFYSQYLRDLLEG